MPHKLKIYAQLMATVMRDNFEIGSAIVQDVVNSALSTALFKEADAFKARNFFRWLGYLVDYQAVSPKTALALLTHLLQE